MFTGIIEHIGTIVSSHPTDSGLRLLIDPCGWGFTPEPGDSVAVNGCCLTLVDPLDDHKGKMSFDVIPETLDKTTMGMLGPGDRVNLESPLRMGDHLDGHTVQGHIEGRGIIEVIDTRDGYRVRVRILDELMKFMIPEGSITIDGISLTIARVDPRGKTITVALIPETLERTTLGTKTPDDALNIESDMMVKTIVHTIEQMNHPGS